MRWGRRRPGRGIASTLAQHGARPDRQAAEALSAPHQLRPLGPPCPRQAAATWEAAGALRGTPGPPRPLWGPRPRRAAAGTESTSRRAEAPRPDRTRQPARARRPRPDGEAVVPHRGEHVAVEMRGSLAPTPEPYRGSTTSRAGAP